MLGTIITREIQEHLKSSKFQLGFLITIALISISTSINIRDYIQRNQDYLTARAETKDRFYVSVYKAPRAEEFRAISRYSEKTSQIFYAA